MSGTRKIILGALTVIALTAGMAPAFADKGGNGHGKWSQESDNSYVKKSYNQNSKDEENYNDRNDNRTNVVRIYDNDRTVLRRYAEEHYKKYCPPGLAKKHGECLQYGQLKKRYKVGYRLPENILYYPVPRDVITHLQPIAGGYEYVRVDNDVLLMQSATRQIIDAVVLLATNSR